MTGSGRPITWKMSSGIVVLGLAVTIAVALNVIVSGVSIRKDLTEEKLFELSDGTRHILRQLSQKVTLTFYFNRGEADVHVSLKAFADRVEDLLKEFELAAGGKLEVLTCDPKPDSDEEQAAQRYGLRGHQLGPMGPIFYLGLVAHCGEREEVIPFLDPQLEELLEYTLARTIVRVSVPKKPTLGLISSLPVAGERRPRMPMPGMPEPSPAWLAFQELRADYTIREIHTPTSEIGDDIDCLLVIHPKHLDDETLFALDQFVLRGGRLIAFLDPFCMVDPGGPEMQWGPRSSNLEKLLHAWGVAYEASKVVADVEAMTRVRAAGNRIEDSLVWLSLRAENFHREDVVMSGLDSLMMICAGSFSVNETKDLKVTPLVTASGSSCLVDATMAQFGGDAMRREFKARGVRLPLALRLHGKLKTAFPEGKPKKEEEKKDKDTKKQETRETEGKDATPSSLKESQTTSLVVLVGDVDMLHDRHCIREISFLGFAGYAPINKNLAFLANLVEQMVGGQALVGVRSRGRTERPFKRVLALQHRAQERFLERETELQRRLDEAQRRLTELEGQKGKQQRVFLSREQQQEIENFRQQVIRTKEELRQVRRNLREDIERLGTTVKAINLLAMPLVVAFTGIGAHVFRRFWPKRDTGFPA